MNINMSNTQQMMNKLVSSSPGSASSGSASAAGPPASGPPASGPPASGPPGSGPPGSGPSASGPPASGPPAFGPPTSAHGKQPVQPLAPPLVQPLPPQPVKPPAPQPAAAFEWSSETLGSFNSSPSVFAAESKPSNAFGNLVGGAGGDPGQTGKYAVNAYRDMMAKGGAIPSMLKDSDKTRYRKVLELFNSMATKAEQVALLILSYFLTYLLVPTHSSSTYLLLTHLLQAILKPKTVEEGGQLAPEAERVELAQKVNDLVCEFLQVKLTEAGQTYSGVKSKMLMVSAIEEVDKKLKKVNKPTTGSYKRQEMQEWRASEKGDGAPGEQSSQGASAGKRLRSDEEPLLATPEPPVTPAAGSSSSGSLWGFFGRN